jgi:hypothetical protein
MHFVIIDNPVLLPNYPRLLVRFPTFSVRRSLQILRAAALRMLLEIAAVVILVLIPWNTAS